jgi:hypothetical protein
MRQTTDQIWLMVRPLRLEFSGVVSYLIELTHDKRSILALRTGSCLWIALGGNFTLRLAGLPLLVKSQVESLTGEIDPE